MCAIGRGHVRPERPGRLLVVGVAPELGRGKRELAVAVVLGHGIGTARGGAARHLAVPELERREPEQEVGGPRLHGPSRSSADDVSAPSRIHERA